MDIARSVMNWFEPEGRREPLLVNSTSVYAVISRFFSLTVCLWGT